MRRTTPMVLMLAVVLAGTTLGSPVLTAQSSATRRAASASHRAGKPSKTSRASKASDRRTSHASTSRKHAAAPCVAPTPTAKVGGHTASRHANSMGRDSNNSRIAQTEKHRRRSTSEPEAAVPATRAAIAPPTPAAPQPQPVSFRWNRHVVPPPMRGSLESLERQNDRTNAEGLERIEDEADLSDRIARGALVPVPASAALEINPDLSEHHRYCRPWAARFLADLARAHQAQFHAPIQVSSAVRTVEYQRHLIGIKGNAAPADGDIASPHLTGATVDIAKKGMSSQQIGWMRSYLTPLQAAGKIDVEEEFQQSCFHITVYKSYAPARSPRSRQSKTIPNNAEVAGGQSALGR